MKLVILILTFSACIHYSTQAQKIYKNKIVYEGEDVTVIDAKNISWKGDTIISITEDRFRSADSKIIKRFLPFGWVNGKILSIKERYWQAIKLDSPQAALIAFQDFTDYEERVLSDEDKKHINYTFVLSHAKKKKK